jgi:hypothetical protein
VTTASGRRGGDFDEGVLLEVEADSILSEIGGKNLKFSKKFKKVTKEAKNDTLYVDLMRGSESEWVLE